MLYLLILPFRDKRLLLLPHFTCRALLSESTPEVRSVLLRAGCKSCSYSPGNSLKMAPPLFVLLCLSIMASSSSTVYSLRIETLLKIVYPLEDLIGVCFV